MLKILRHDPIPTSIYAARTIKEWYNKAFKYIWCEFKIYTCSDNLEQILNEYNPDLFITALSTMYLKQLDIIHMNNFRAKWWKVLSAIPYWTSPFEKSRINEPPSLSNDKPLLNIIANWFADYYHTTSEQDDPRMEWFTKNTWYKYHTLPLWVDTLTLNPFYNEKFQSDISFIGTYLPQKKPFFKKMVFPLKKQYSLSIYGQDRTIIDRYLGWVQKFWQYFNINFLSSIRKPKLWLNDEAQIYNSSKICINVHEEYQRKYWFDCNERTFKIPFCNWFQVTDNVHCIKKYFIPWEEIIIAESENDRFDKINFYMRNSSEREKIITAWKKRVIKDHSYIERAKYILKFTGLYE